MHKVGIISGSLREGRKSSAIAKWVLTEATAFEAQNVTFELVEIADFDLPFVTGALPPGALGGRYPDERVQAWADTIASFDAFIFVTPEYNHGVPSGLKNAVDHLSPEWHNKVVSLISYGADGGVRAVEQWRQVLANFNMYDLRQTVSLKVFEEFPNAVFTPQPSRTAQLHSVLAQLTETLARFK